MGQLIRQLVIVVIAFAALLLLIAPRAGAPEMAVLTVLFLAAVGLVVHRHRRRTPR
ncbi:hypothetical protein [Streptomyces sp. NBC_01320]|jgi:hypothetical protein|uniref:hypothetical protein n=1 Tax=Streptomyces sp. NBC_01320 TaxID=2903824 RepID=UPI002E134BDD|nr:hypothetical protein OG395_23425 [Streptomyces sp. NBC_01320]